MIQQVHKPRLQILLSFFYHFTYMSEDTTTSLIVTLKGTTDIEKDGRIIRFGSGANLSTVRGLAAEKLGIAGNPEDLVLLDASDHILAGIEQVRDQQVVHVDHKNHIREVPGPRGLPFVGNLPEMLPNTYVLPSF